MNLALFWTNYFAKNLITLESFLFSGSECVIHTHSKCANLITQLIKSNVFEISHQEYIKGIYDPFSGKALKYSDTLTIPIIDNMPSESQLLVCAINRSPMQPDCFINIALFQEPIRGVLENYPQAIAVLVRNHGLFVWGPTWESTKIMWVVWWKCVISKDQKLLFRTECIDYLLELSIEMLKNNIPLVNEEAFEKEDNLSDKMRTLMFGDMAPVWVWKN